MTCRVHDKCLLLYALSEAVLPSSMHHVHTSTEYDPICTKRLCWTRSEAVMSAAVSAY